LSHQIKFVLNLNRVWVIHFIIKSGIFCQRCVIIRIINWYLDQFWKNSWQIYSSIIIMLASVCILLESRFTPWGCRVLWILITYLKRWDVSTLLKAVFFCRAMPWTRLLLKEGRFDNDLNLNFNSLRITKWNIGRPQWVAFFNEFLRPESIKGGLYKYKASTLK
jgi:hypothetical protein